MAMSTLVLWALLALVLAVVLAAATRPDSFRVERSLVVQASTVQVLALLADFHRWAEWSPWEQIDPSMQRSYSGPASGKGAVYAWSGNGKAGKGRMELVDVQADRVLIQIDFLKPFEAHNTVEFTLHNQGEETLVVWAMYGPSPFISRLMGLVISMDRLVGPDFEKGLANLQASLKVP
jgi:hypothetical protein